MAKYYKVKISNKHYSAIVILEQDDTLQDALNLVGVKAKDNNLPFPVEGDLVTRIPSEVQDPLFVGLTSFELKKRNPNEVDTSNRRPCNI